MKLTVATNILLTAILFENTWWNCDALKNNDDAGSLSVRSSRRELMAGKKTSQPTSSLRPTSVGKKSGKKSTEPSASPTDSPEPTTVPFEESGMVTLSTLSRNKRRLEIIEDLGGNPDANKPYVKEDLLTKNDRTNLRDYVIKKQNNFNEKSRKEEDYDFILPMDITVLQRLISTGSIENIYSSFREIHKATPSEFDLRLTKYMSSSNKSVPFHIDCGINRKTMILFLNEEDEDKNDRLYCNNSGSLVYLFRDGTHTIESKAGMGVFHGSDHVHGVTEVTNTTRYVLLASSYGSEDGTRSYDDDDDINQGPDVSVDLLSEL